MNPKIGLSCIFPNATRLSPKFKLNIFLLTKPIIFFLGEMTTMKFFNIKRTSLGFQSSLSILN
eukprot:snap_masked-scaffold_30-processed-gene-0.28-mRNA-1 protein AED:1.00 eAED:1.00 QI:0/0/0/0/1/1/2/0/62